MRKGFEKLPEIADRLDGICWNAELNIYQTEYPILFNAVGFINGAWYAYQEQQKIINMQECGAKKILEVLNDENLFYENKCDTIKELLK